MKQHQLHRRDCQGMFKSGVDTSTLPLSRGKSRNVTFASRYLTELGLGCIICVSPALSHRINGYCKIFSGLWVSITQSMGLLVVLCGRGNTQRLNPPCKIPPPRGFFFPTKRFQEDCILLPQSCSPHAWQLCTTLKPSSVRAFKWHQGETQAKPRKYSEEKIWWGKKNHFKALI